MERILGEEKEEKTGGGMRGEEQRNIGEGRIDQKIDGRGRRGRG